MVKSDNPSTRNLDKIEKEGVDHQSISNHHARSSSTLKERSSEKNNASPKKVTYESKPKDGYFTRTSKENQSAAAKALSAFVGGIILFILSIHLICWNERRAVKDAQYLDYFTRTDRCAFIDNGNEASLTESRLSIVTGEVNVIKEASIEFFNINITSNKGKIVMIKSHFEQFSTMETEKEKEVGEDQEGNALIEKELTTHRIWSDTDKINSSKFKTEFHAGEVNMSGKYRFSMDHFKSLVNSSQTEKLTDNKNIYFPNSNDLPAIEEFYNKENNDPSKPYKYLIKDAYIYILRSNIKVEDSNSFDPEKYEFSNSDFRLSFKYYFIDDKEKNFTVVGELSKSADEKTGLKDIKCYNTNLNMAGCSYYCCCCADSDVKYTIDMLYPGRLTREDIVKRLQDGIQTCTCILRVCGFLMHFLSIYLILYPLILLIGMIPFLGAIGATILIFFAFILSLMTFLFIIACAWICARPVYAVLIFGFIFVLFFVGKSSNDHLKSHDQNYNNNEYNGGNNNHQTHHGPSKRDKFL